jgi:hypothetical protein
LRILPIFFPILKLKKLCFYYCWPISLKKGAWLKESIQNWCLAFLQDYDHYVFGPTCGSVVSLHESWSWFALFSNSGVLKVDFVIAIQCNITRDMTYAALYGSLIFGCIFRAVVSLPSNISVSGLFELQTKQSFLSCESCRRQPMSGVHQIYCVSMVWILWGTQEGRGRW